MFNNFVQKVKQSCLQTRQRCFKSDLLLQCLFKMLHKILKIFLNNDFSHCCKLSSSWWPHVKLINRFAVTVLPRWLMLSSYPICTHLFKPSLAQSFDQILFIFQGNSLLLLERWSPRLRGNCTPGPYFWSLCAFSQQINKLRTKYPMDLVRNVPRNLEITVLLQ